MVLPLVKVCCVTKNKSGYVLTPVTVPGSYEEE